MRLAFLLLFALLSSQQAMAQNLVLNPSFEDLKPDRVVVACEFMQFSNQFDHVVKGWTSYPDMTPDLLGAAENCPWLTRAHSGQNCLGLIHYLPAMDADGTADYHEFVRGKLATALEPGRKYRVECWVYEDTTIIRAHLFKVYDPQTPVMPTRAGNLGFYFFTEEKYNVAQRPQVVFTDIIVTNGAWVKRSAEFVADEPYDHLKIGNFSSDRLTPNDLNPAQADKAVRYNAKISDPLKKIKRAAYLCLDDVSVTPVDPAPSLETALLRDRKFTFNAGVLFDSGRSMLRLSAGQALDSLVFFLKKYPEARIGISGHTDDVGSDASNLALSEKRANAVLRYLVDHGIGGKRLFAKGFGETRPVADNTSEAGRQLNRRVECVLLK